MSIIDENSQSQTFDGQVEIDRLVREYVAAIKEVEDSGNREIQAIKDVYVGMIDLERASPKPSEKKIKKLTANSYTEIQKSVKNTMEEAIKLAEIHGPAVMKVCKEFDLQPPDKKTVDISLISSELYPKEKGKEKPQEVDKKLSLEDKLGWAIFFIIAPLGMVIIEDYFLGGLLFIVGAILHFPAMSKAILRTYPWVNSLNLICISNALILAGFLKVLHFS